MIHFSIIFIVHFFPLQINETTFENENEQEVLILGKQEVYDVIKQGLSLCVINLVLSYDSRIIFLTNQNFHFFVKNVS